MHSVIIQFTVNDTIIAVCSFVHVNFLENIVVFNHFNHFSAVNVQSDAV